MAIAMVITEYEQVVVAAAVILTSVLIVLPVDGVRR